MKIAKIITTIFYIMSIVILSLISYIKISSESNESPKTIIKKMILTIGIITKKVYIDSTFLIFAFIGIAVTINSNTIILKENNIDNYIVLVLMFTVISFIIAVIKCSSLNDRPIELVSYPVVLLIVNLISSRTALFVITAVIFCIGLICKILLLRILNEK